MNAMTPISHATAARGGLFAGACARHPVGAPRPARAVVPRSRKPAVVANLGFAAP